MRIDKITVLGAAIVAVAGIGIGTAGASSTAEGVKACVTGSGYLQTAARGGHCPTHTTRVTIAKQGPQGEPGPGALSIVLNPSNALGAKTITLPTGDTIKGECGLSGGYGQVTIRVTPPPTVNEGFVSGTADIDNGTSGGAAVLTEDDPDLGLSANLTDDHNSVEFLGVGPWSLSFNGVGASATLTAHLLLTRGSRTYTLDMLAVSNNAEPRACVLGVQLTPSS